MQNLEITWIFPGGKSTPPRSHPVWGQTGFIARAKSDVNGPFIGTTAKKSWKNISRIKEDGVISEKKLASETWKIFSTIIIQI